MLVVERMATMAAVTARPPPCSRSGGMLRPSTRPARASLGGVQPPWAAPARLPRSSPLRGVPGRPSAVGARRLGLGAGVRASAAATGSVIGDKATKTQLGKLKVAELKEELASRGLPTTGLKAELVARLLDALSEPSAVAAPAPTPPPSGAGARLAETEQLKSAQGQVEEFEERVHEETGHEQQAELRKRINKLNMQHYHSIKQDFSNPSGLELMFLGTSSGEPSIYRNVTSIMLRFEKKMWMVDCGEGTQHQFLKCPLKGSKISRIFVTHMHGDHCFGLPGMIASILHSRSEESLNENESLEIYGPPGLYEFIETSIGNSRTHLATPVIVHELTYPDDKRPSRSASSIARNLFRQEIHPMGGHGAPGAIVKRKGTINGSRGEGYWPVCKEGNFTMVAAHLAHKVECFGYTVFEADQPGHIDAEKCTALGLPPGREYKKLKDGIPVTLEDGRTIHPEDVVGGALKGRKVVVLGDTCNPELIAPIAQGADLLVHESTFHHDMMQKALIAGHSTASMAGQFARKVGAKNLVLTHFSNRYDNEAAWPPGEYVGVSDLVREAQQTFGSKNVVAAHDFFRCNVERGDEGSN